MTKPNIIYEDIALLHWGHNLVVRPWVKSDSLRDSKGIEAIAAMRDYMDKTVPPKLVFQAIELLVGYFKDKLAALEVKHSNGDGKVVYLDWP